MDRAGTLPLNLYETQTSLNPLDLQFVFPHAQSSVPDESPESETDEHPVEVITCTDQRDDYSISANSHACGLKTSISRRLTPAGQFLTPD